MTLTARKIGGDARSRQLAGHMDFPPGSKVSDTLTPKINTSKGSFAARLAPGMPQSRRRCFPMPCRAKAPNSQLSNFGVTVKMRKLALLVVLPSLLAGCTSGQMNMLMGTRNKTYNDVNAAWVGSTEEQLISKWGPPKKSYTLASGATIISYEEIWGPMSAYHVCAEKFMIEKGMVTKWGISDCPSRISGTLPKDTPIPQPTL